METDNVQAQPQQAPTQPRCCDSKESLSPHSCAHLKEFKEGEAGIDTYTTIQQYLQSCKAGAIEQSKLPLPRCFECKEYGGRLHICLQCVYIGCWSEGHLKKHFEESKHYLAVEVTLGNVYCKQCGDYVYDSEFEDITTVERHNALACKQKLNAAHPQQLAGYTDWKATPEQKSELERLSKPYTVPTYALGLRGLINLGNTCFMNVILQSFLHNPLMRNYFLSDMHNSRFCEQAVTGDNSSGICLGCEMDILFSKIFSGVRSPYTPHHMLYSIWKYANYFAGYEQQDAHEFLISSLNGIHTHCGGVSKDCKCIIHRIFYGLLRSDVTCSSCGFTSVTFDPCFDISLDIPKPHKSGEKRKLDSSGELEAGNTLLECLDRFTQKERLGTNEKFLCSQCNTRQESIKQLSLKALPVVACFHLKRFEQAQNPRHSNKIDTFIEFPAELDMSPYLSIKIQKENDTESPKSQQSDSPKTQPKTESPKNPKSESPKSLQISEAAVEAATYDLIAVVNHQGKMDNGHYTSFVKHDEKWFKCDDATITRATQSQVLKSKGYLLFYMKKQLEYNDVNSSSTVKEQK